jgi:hypothetical protein
MTARNCHVVLSSKEKQKLDDVATARYGTQEVPYGLVVDALASDYLHDAMKEQHMNESPKTSTRSRSK